MGLFSLLSMRARLSRLDFMAPAPPHQANTSPASPVHCRCFVYYSWFRFNSEFQYWNLQEVLVLWILHKTNENLKLRTFFNLQYIVLAWALGCPQRLIPRVLFVKERGTETLNVVKCNWLLFACFYRQRLKICQCFILLWRSKLSDSSWPVHEYERWSNSVFFFPFLIHHTLLQGYIWS